MHEAIADLCRSFYLILSAQNRIQVILWLSNVISTAVIGQSAPVLYSVELEWRQHIELIFSIIIHYLKLFTLRFDVSQTNVAVSPADTF